MFDYCYSLFAFVFHFTISFRFHHSTGLFMIRDEKQINKINCGYCLPVYILLYVDLWTENQFTIIQSDNEKWQTNYRNLIMRKHKCTFSFFFFFALIFNYLFPFLNWTLKVGNDPKSALCWIVDK